MRTLCRTALLHTWGAAGGGRGDREGRDLWVLLPELPISQDRDVRICISKNVLSDASPAAAA